MAMAPFSPSILAITISISIFLSFISPSHSAITCASQKLPPNRAYANCTDLPSLSATLHFTYNTTNSSVAVAFTATPPSPDSWVAWGVNPTAGGMVGTQALIAYKHDGKVEVHLYNLTSYKGIDPVKSLSFETWDVAAVDSGGAITIFAAIKVPEKTDNVSQVWQVGPVASGKPVIHEFKPENLQAVAALPSVASTSVVGSGNSTSSRNGGGNSTSAGGVNSTSSGGGNSTSGGDEKSGAFEQRIGLGFYLGLVLVLISFIITM